MNQVYFYLTASERELAALLNCLNPFMNQVYFYAVKALFKEFNEE